MVLLTRIGLLFVVLIHLGAAPESGNVDLYLVFYLRPVSIILDPFILQPPVQLLHHVHHRNAPLPAAASLKVFLHHPGENCVESTDIGRPRISIQFLATFRDLVDTAASADETRFLQARGAAILFRLTGCSGVRPRVCVGGFKERGGLQKN